MDTVTIKASVCRSDFVLASLEGICYLPPETGPCEALITQWYYNPKAGRCLQFIYGGCEGNENRFDTLADCQTACRKGWAQENEKGRQCLLL